MIKTIAIVIAVAIAALLLYAATRPDSMHIERSALIKASADKVHPLINDLHSFNTWNPYNKKDVAMTVTYRGPATGPGSAFDFDGDKSAGKGSISIVEPAGPNRVSMKLDMSSPMEAHNDIAFTLVPLGSNATQVTWAMHCQSPFIGKLMGVFINMDKMIGRDFETGLASLKTLAERP